MEAFAWDLESNTRRKVQFTVQHVREKKGGNITLTDPRDIYELLANQAQRRVRTCLENIIPRDIQDAACEECDKTLKAEIKDIAKASDGLLKAFMAIGVSREQIEARIQRRLDAITPAQIIALRKIGASIRDGISDPADWFPVAATDGEQKSTLDKAKDALRKPTANGSQPTKPEATQPPKPDEASQEAPAAATEGVDEPASDEAAGINRQAIKSKFEMLVPGEEEKARRFYDSLLGPDSVVELAEGDSDWIHNMYQATLTRLAKAAKAPKKGKPAQAEAF